MLFDAFSLCFMECERDLRHFLFPAVYCVNRAGGRDGPSVEFPTSFLESRNRSLCSSTIPLLHDDDAATDGFAPFHSKLHGTALTVLRSNRIEERTDSGSVLFCTS